jgi:dTDP-4-dehydrorhamnose reductase
MGVRVRGTTRRRVTCRTDRLPLDLEADLREWEVPDGTSIALLGAGSTSLDACRARPDATRYVNVEQTVAVAERLIERGVFVVFLSTNLVFDGERPRRRAEDRTSPRTEYGRQKAEAERRLLGLGGSVAVVRLSKVMDGATPLIGGWVRDLRNGRPIQPLSDMVMAPVPLDFAVPVIAQVGLRRVGGILQVSAPDDVSYAAAAQVAARRVGASADLVRPIGVAESGVRLEAVPRHTTLDTSRIELELGAHPPAAEVALERIMAGAG